VTRALRASLIWNGEVMEDLVLERPGKITLGQSKRSTFVVPKLGLPAEFAIVRPGNRGYLLTLAPPMSGTICLDGKERAVADLVRSSGAASSGPAADDSGVQLDGEPATFHATPISDRDWGVIQLDARGELQLFFQFVPIDDPPQFLTPAVIAAGTGGFLLASAALTVVWWLRDVPLLEAIARGSALVAGALALAALGWWALAQDNDQKAALVFSVLLHLALLFTTYQLYSGEDPFVWPGSRALTGSYLITRLEPPPPPEPPKVVPTVGKVNQEEAAAASPTPQSIKTATKGEEGASGGKGEQERARTPTPNESREPPKVAFFEDRNRKFLDNIVERNLATSMGKFAGIEGPSQRGSMGMGVGTGTGVGDGTQGTGTTRGSKKGGPGGGGNVEGDFVTHRGPVDAGTQRPGGTCVGPGCKGAGPREVKVAIGEMTGDPGGLTAEEINRVVRARAGVFRACYQKELNRTPGIGGKLVVRFKIDGAGVVQNAAIAGGSTLANEGVASCVTSNVMRLRFPAKGGAANVTYPFVFSPGG
jgi:hypothetical protein